MPSVVPTQSLGLSDSNDSGGLSIYVGMDYLYVSIIIFVIFSPVILGYLIAKHRILYNTDLLNEINKVELYLSPLISYAFFGNWVYTIVSSLILNKSNSSGIIVVNILSIILRSSSIILVLYIQKYISDPVSEGSLYHKIADNNKQVSLADSQFLFQVVSFVMYINPDSVKILPWKRSNFSGISGGYPCYWLYKFCLLYQLFFSAGSLLLTIVRLSLGEITPANIINIVFVVINFLSLKSSNVYSLVRGKLSLEFEKYDDDDDAEKRREADMKLSISGDNELTDFKSYRDSLTKLEKEDIDSNMLAEKYEVMVAELSAKLQKEIEERESRLSGNSSRSSSINDQDAEIQRNQLKDLGVVPLVFIPLADIRKEVNAMISGEITMNDTRFDYLMKCMLVNPDFIEEQKQERLKWVQEITPLCRGWFEEMNRIIPSAINMTSTADLEKAGYPKALASRFHLKKCLWLIKMDPEKIRKIHIADFRGKFSYQSQGLDIVELAAIYMSLPQTFENDGKGDKMRFKTELEDKLSVSYKEYKQGKLKPALVRHPAYTGFDPSNIQLEVNKRLSYSFKPIIPVDLSEDLENQAFVINPITAKESNEDRNTIKYSGKDDQIGRNNRSSDIRSEDTTATSSDNGSNGSSLKANRSKPRVTAPPGLVEALKKSNSKHKHDNL